MVALFAMNLDATTSEWDRVKRLNEHLASTSVNRRVQDHQRRSVAAYNKMALRPLLAAIHIAVLLLGVGFSPVD